MTSGDETGSALYSIGEVAEATGLSVDTIRIWERRYGRPRPLRLDSRHRRYTEDQVRWLRRVAEALARGHRPSRVVRLEDSELDELLEPIDTRAEDPYLLGLIDLVREFSGAELVRALRTEAERLGPREFVLRRSAPLLTLAGRAWADGAIDVRHEHFLSEILEDRLRRLREGVGETAGNHVALLATLAGERHGLGLQMAALIGRLSGLSIRMFGTDSPIPEIVAATAETRADLVGISVSLATGGPHTDRGLASLRDSLPAGVHLVAGGRGARGVRRGPRGITYVKDLPEFELWISDL